jgi:hypothetical protein
MSMSDRDIKKQNKKADKEIRKAEKQAERDREKQQKEHRKRADEYSEQKDRQIREADDERLKNQLHMEKQRGKDSPADYQSAGLAENSTSIGGIPHGVPGGAGTHAVPQYPSYTTSGVTNEAAPRGGGAPQIADPTHDRHPDQSYPMMTTGGVHNDNPVIRDGKPPVNVPGSSTPGTNPAGPLPADAKVCHGGHSEIGNLPFASAHTAAVGHSVPMAATATTTTVTQPAVIATETCPSHVVVHETRVDPNLKLVSDTLPNASRTVGSH